MRTTNPSRRSAALLLGAILLTAPAAAQDAQAAQQAAEAEAKAQAQQQERDVRVLRVRSEDADQIAELLHSFEVFVRTSRQLGLITISGVRERVARAEQAVREIEKLTMRTPASVAKDVDLTVHFLGIVDKETAAVPPMLRDVVAELRKTFPFPGYELMETIALRARVGERARVEGLLPQELSEQIPPKQYDFQVQVAGIEPREATSQIRFDHIRASIRFPLPNPGQPNSYHYESAEIGTALEVPDGKTVVVGKAGATGDSKGYLLVLTAKVVN